MNKEYEVRGKVWREVGSKVRDEIWSKVRDEVWIEVRDKVWIETGSNNVRRDVENKLWRTELSYN